MARRVQQFHLTCDLRARLSGHFLCNQTLTNLNMTIKPHEKRNDDLLLQQFKMVMDKLVPRRRKGYVSGPDFDKCCREMYGTSIRSSLQKRFGSGKGMEDGFNIMKTMFGYPTLRTYGKQEVLDIYIKVYKEKGKQPTEGDIEKVISMNSVYRHFGRHMNAVDAKGFRYRWEGCLST
jgi:hypothetical protein